MHNFFCKCSSIELRWIMHIIIGDLEHSLGIPHSSTILFWLNRDADQMIRAGDSLKNVCDIFTSFSDNESVIDSELIGSNLLCKPFRPMLLKRLNYNKDCLPKVNLTIYFIICLQTMLDYKIMQPTFFFGA